MTKARLLLSSMTENTKQNSGVFRSFLRLAVLLLLGLSIFFFAAILILSMRLKADSRVEVPQLTGKSYLDEHNLLQSRGFKVELSAERSLLYPYGFILAQSLPAGEIVNKGAKLNLTVNQSQTIIKTPELVGMKINLAREALQNIHYGPYTFSLRMGVVTPMFSSKPEGEVLAQFPPSGTPLTPDMPVHLLVASSKKEQELSALTHIEILKKMAYLQNKTLEVQKQESDVAETWDRVASLQTKDESWIATVLKAKTDEKTAADTKYNMFRVRWLNPIDLGLIRGVYTVAKIFDANKELTDDNNAPKGDANLKTNKNVVFKDIVYMYITSEDIPLFENLTGIYAFWQGKHSPQELADLAYKKIPIGL